MIIIDIEASGLGERSYPIEVAWGHRADPTLKDSFMIRPEPGWTHWDDHAETAIHGISRDQLLTDGITAEQACSRLNRALAGEVVYSDYVPSDRPWLMRLFRAADMTPEFRFGHVQSLLPPEKIEVYYSRFSATPTVHRALADVEKIIKTLNFIAPV